MVKRANKVHTIFRVATVQAALVRVRGHSFADVHLVTFTDDNQILCRGVRGMDAGARYNAGKIGLSASEYCVRRRGVNVCARGV